jgi:hypothetical protein
MTDTHIRFLRLLTNQSQRQLAHQHSTHQVEDAASRLRGEQLEQPAARTTARLAHAQTRRTTDEQTQRPDPSLADRPERTYHPLQRRAPDVNEPEDAIPVVSGVPLLGPQGAVRFASTGSAEGSVFRLRSTDERRLTDRHSPGIQAVPRPTVAGPDYGSGDDAAPTHGTRATG